MSETSKAMLERIQQASKKTKPAAVVPSGDITESPKPLAAVPTTKQARTMTFRLLPDDVQRLNELAAYIRLDPAISTVSSTMVIRTLLRMAKADPDLMATFKAMLQQDGRILRHQK